MFKIEFSPDFYDDFERIKKENSKIGTKILTLILEISESPFTGTGKPEALKNELSGQWSRHITDKHRLVYQVIENTVIIFSCFGHYGDK